MAAFSAKFNEQEYEVEIFIDDGTGPSTRFYINPAAIINLSIEDTLADWAVRGTITLVNNFELIENLPSNAIRSSNNSFYFFRKP